MIKMPWHLPMIFMVGLLVVGWTLSMVLERRLGSRFKDVARMVRSMLLPCFLTMWLVTSVIGYKDNDVLTKSLQTILGFAVVWFCATTLQAFFLRESRSDSVRARTPLLLVDIVRLCFVVVGMVLVYSGVWQKDVSPLLTTFGVGSLVVGLALQDTLGNLFAGLALVFERPVVVGDWIQLGDVVGKVRQINWRSVRIVTRELNEITIPNSAIGKDRIINFSHPSRVHGLKVTFGFSYDAPPNTVKEMLLTTALETPGILSEPAPDPRTLEFAAYAVTYELRFFIADYEQYVSIRNDLMSRVWYAARRHGIQIPYPITTLYKTEVPYVPPESDATQPVAALIKSTDLFRDLSDGEALMLARDVAVQSFGRNERLIREGEVGDEFFVLMQGSCSVQVQGADGGVLQVNTLSSGAIVGEMALLSGTPRMATVVANTDVTAARITKKALANLLDKRADLLSTLAHYAAERSKQLEALRIEETKSIRNERGEIDERALGERIRRFFGL